MRPEDLWPFDPALVAQVDQTDAALRDWAGKYVSDMIFYTKNREGISASIEAEGLFYHLFDDLGALDPVLVRQVTYMFAALTIYVTEAVNEREAHGS